MDIIHELGRASAAEVHARLPEAPGYSAVRAMLAKLESKGQLTHSQDGPRYVFQATESRSAAQQRALARLLRVFFDDSPVKAVNALLDTRASLSREELDALRKAIEAARDKGR